MAQDACILSLGQRLVRGLRRARIERTNPGQRLAKGAADASRIAIFALAHRKQEGPPVCGGPSKVDDPVGGTPE
jgi:hypothetical protein